MGGHVFENCESIKREYIESTLENYITHLKLLFPKVKFFDDYSIVGSAGKKRESGDIDIVYDISHFKPYPRALKRFEINKGLYEAKLDIYKSRARTATVDQLKLRSIMFFIADQILFGYNKAAETRILPAIRKVGIGTLFTSFPQFKKGKPTNKRVQVDIMVGNKEWLEFSYYSAQGYSPIRQFFKYFREENYESNIKGLHRTQLILSLFANYGYTFSHQYGVKHKESGKIVATSVQEAINLLSTLYQKQFTRNILNDYIDLHMFIRELPEYSSVIDIYLQIIDKTRADVPYDLQSYWMQNTKRLNLTGKFLPEYSVLRNWIK